MMELTKSKLSYFLVALLIIVALLDLYLKGGKVLATLKEKYGSGGSSKPSSPSTDDPTDNLS